MHSVYPCPFFSLDGRLPVPLLYTHGELAYMASSRTILFSSVSLIFSVSFLWLLICEVVRIQLLQTTSINTITTWKLTHTSGATHRLSLLVCTP